MLRIILLILLFIYPGSGDPQPDRRKVKLIVQGDDDNVQNRIRSKMVDQLLSLSGHINLVTDNSAVFTITINESLISCDGEVAGISMASILTKKITTNDNRTTEEILMTNFATIRPTDVEPKCVDVIAKFDNKYMLPNNR